MTVDSRALAVLGTVLLLTGCPPRPRPARPVPTTPVPARVSPEGVAPVARAEETAPGEVRIGLFRKSERVVVECRGPYTMSADNVAGGDASEGHGRTVSGPFEVRAGSDTLFVSDEPVGRRLVIRPSDGIVRVNHLPFRGALEVLWLRSGELMAVERVGLELYLYGILKREVSPTWPPESLKAQAVAARTFTLKTIGKHGAEGFDLCRETHCQVYGGLNAEDPRTTAAVDRTRGEVLLYRGAPAAAFYHSNCGGRTADVGEVWGGGQPYLRGVRCSFCREDRDYLWRRVVEGADLANKLGLPGRVTAVTPKGTTGSGRVRRVVVKYAGGSRTLSATEFRNLVGPNRIMSTRFTVKSSKGEFVFIGRGWGHGVGLCQWGARGQARQGRSYRKILRFYYPGTELGTP